MAKGGLSGDNYKSEKFVDFRSFHSPITDSTMAKPRTCYKVSWASTNRKRTKNQIAIMLRSAVNLEVVFRVRVTKKVTISPPKGTI